MPSKECLPKAVSHEVIYNDAILWQSGGLLHLHDVLYQSSHDIINDLWNLFCQITSGMVSGLMAHRKWMKIKAF